MKIPEEPSTFLTARPENAAALTGTHGRAESRGRTGTGGRARVSAGTYLLELLLVGPVAMVGCWWGGLRMARPRGEPLLPARHPLRLTPVVLRCRRLAEEQGARAGPHRLC